MTSVALPPPSPRDAEVRDVVLRLVEVCAWRDASAVLQARLREIDGQRLDHVQRLFLAWSDLDADSRPDFRTYAHKRRKPGLEAPA